MTNTAVLLSGGVDSLVTAGILKNQGMSLFGIHFYTGYESAQEKCSEPDLHQDVSDNPSRDMALEKAHLLEQQLDISIDKSAVVNPVFRTGAIWFHWGRFPLKLL